MNSKDDTKVEMPNKSEYMEAVVLTSRLFFQACHPGQVGFLVRPV
jgi:hypothetical protein